MSLEIPQQFSDLIGNEVQYSLGDKKIEGVVKDCRFSRSFILDLKTRKSWHAVELKIKPSDKSYNAGKAFWTKAFNSNIPREDE